MGFFFCFKNVVKFNPKLVILRMKESQNYMRYYNFAIRISNRAIAIQ